MSDWQTDLTNKFNIIKKEEENGQIISSARISDRDNTGSSRDVHRVSVHKEVNNVKKEEKIMITKEAAMDDLKKLDSDAPVGKILIAVAEILIKILTTIRSNQLLTDEEKVKIREARKERDAKKEQK